MSVHDSPTNPSSGPSSDGDNFVSYQVGGALPSSAPSYVERDADEILYKALKAREFCYILNSRQMGKSSLQVRAITRLQKENIRCIAIDFTTLGNQNITPEQWYASIIHDLIMGFGLTLDFMDWWETIAHTSLNKRLDLFFEQILLTQIKQPIVIFIDEIDSVLSLPFPCDDFFALLRACYNRRALTPSYQRLTFAFAGVAAPADFMLNKQRTPFNIGRAIELRGFSRNRSAPLRKGLAPLGKNASAVLEQIFSYTAGQPFLTQKLCQIVVDHSEKLACEPASISPLVESFVFNNWEANDEPEHLRTIRNRILSNQATAASLLELYQQMLKGDRIIVSADPVQIELKLSGLVVEHLGILKIKNKIYRTIFNDRWVQQKLSELRPYATEIEQWLASQNEVFLLKGLALDEALAWAEKKRLGTTDYQFLSLSQERDNEATEQTLEAETWQREQAQIALQAAEEAAQMLGRARRSAKQKKVSVLRRKRWTFGITIAVLFLVSLLRWTGGLQPLEWAMFDHFTRQKPAVAVDERVTVIMVDEVSIQSLGMFPLSDEVLARLLTRISQQQPRMIGLDIYRDLPIAPGTAQLNSVFETTSNLVAIEKVVGTRILPPPALKNVEQHGFADQVLDSDGTVRRGLLSIYAEDTFYSSLALQLATGYLKEEGIVPEPLPNNQIQFGKTVLVPLSENSGGYVRADTGGYQVLLNYRGDASQFDTFSLQDVLQGKVAEGTLRDRVVLIGVTAPTVNDLLLTPYSRKINGVHTQMPGVLLHANLVSQLLNAATEGQPLMRVFPTILNYGWVAVWIFLGALLGSWRRQPLTSVITFFICGLGLYLVCYQAFALGWWIPLVPATLGAMLAAILLVLVTLRQSEKQYLRLAITTILTEQFTNPGAAKIAIEYLKQGESQRNQKFISSIVVAFPTETHPSS